MSYIPGGGGSGATWVTSYNVDFSSLSTGVHPGGDGTVTIDGKTWYAQNVANSNEMRTVNTEGLVIDPSAAATDWYGPTRTAPNFSLKLADLDVNLQKAAVTRFWLYATSTGMDATFETQEFGIGQFQATTMLQSLAKLYNGSAVVFSARTLRDGTTTVAEFTANSSDDVWVLQLHGSGRMEVFTGVYSGGFPAVTALRRRAAITAWDVRAMDNLAFSFAAATVNTSNSFRAVLAAMKVEYLSP